MKTKIILFLLCLATLNSMGQTNGTITRQRKTTVKKETQQRKTTQAAPKEDTAGKAGTAAETSRKHEQT